MQLMTLTEAAEMLRVSRRTVDGWVADNKLAGPLFKKIGGKWLVDRDDLEKWFQEVAK